MNLSEIPRNGIVYRLLFGEFHYTGSTFESLHRRVAQHRDASLRGGNRKLYKHVAENGGWDAAKVLILETNIPDEATLLRKEQSYINLADPLCLNSHPAVAEVVPKRPSVRSDARKTRDRAYYEANREALKEKRRAYYATHKDDPEFRKTHRRQCREAMNRRRAKTEVRL